jgi:hypothetical protein
MKLKPSIDIADAGRLEQPGGGKDEYSLETGSDSLPHGQSGYGDCRCLRLRAKRPWSLGEVPFHPSRLGNRFHHISCPSSSAGGMCVRKPRLEQYIALTNPTFYPPGRHRDHLWHCNSPSRLLVSFYKPWSIISVVLIELKWSNLDLSNGGSPRSCSELNHARRFRMACSVVQSPGLPFRCAG